MATNYGRDLYCAADMDPNMREVTGAELMALVCFRRIYTPRGSLISAPGENTIDLREYLSSEVDLSQTEIVGIKAAAMSAILADPRVLRVTITPTFDTAARSLTLKIDGEGASGPFALVVRASALTVELLSAQR